MEQALKVQPGAPETLANYGMALSSLGRLTEALAALTAGSQPRPATAPVAIAARILSKLGRHDEALADFDRALALNPPIRCPE